MTRMLGVTPGLIFPLLPSEPWRPTQVLRNPGVAPSWGRKVRPARGLVCMWGSWPQALRGPRPGPLRRGQPCPSPQSTVPELSYLGIICVFACIAGQSIGPSEHLHAPLPPGAWHIGGARYLLNEWMPLIGDSHDVLSTFSPVPTQAPPTLEFSVQFTFFLKGRSSSHSFIHSTNIY